METLLQIVQKSAEKELTNSQEKEISNSPYWFIKTSRQVVIFIFRQRTNELIRLSSLLVAQIGLTNTHTEISHWTQSCRSYIIPRINLVRTDFSSIVSR